MKSADQLVFAPIRHDAKPHIRMNGLLLFILCFCGSLGWSQTLPNEVNLEIGKVSGGGSSALNSSSAYVFNFGVTSTGDEMKMSNIKLALSKDNSATLPVIVEIYSGLGATGTLLRTVSIPASLISTGSMGYIAVSVGDPLFLTQGAYSVKISTTASANNQTYNFRPAVATLGDNAGTTLDTSFWLQDSNTTGTAGSTLTPQDGYILADATVNTTTIQLGRFHTNSNPSTSVSVMNAAPASTGNVTESLIISQGTATGASVSSLPGSHIVQGNSDQVGIALSAIAGVQSASVQLNFSSVKDGSNSSRASNDAVSRGSSTITVTGTGYTGKSEWNSDANGSWNKNDYARWDDTGGTPGLDGSASVDDTATFGNAITSNRTISLNGNSPNLRTIEFNNSAASYTIATGTGGVIALGNATNAGSMQNHGGQHTISSAIQLGNRLTFSGALNTLTTLSGSISGAHGLTVQGNGKLVLSADNTYTGSTLVEEGSTLVVNGSLDSSGLTVDSQSTLMGSGSITGITTIYGTHSPGNSPGLQEFDDLSYAANSNLLWELADDTTDGRGTNYDGIDVAGDLSFGDPTTINLRFAIFGSQVDWSNPFWSQNYLGVDGWKIYDVTGSISGLEKVVLASDWLDAQGVLLSDVHEGATFSLFETNDGVYLNYAVIPEPSALLLSALGLLALLRRRRI
jgi:autotransporter-associated beta strand protein